MMNLVALGLVVSTLAAAGVLTPPADQVLREGHRVIVVEYERQFPADHDHEGKDNADKALSESSTKDKVCDALGVCRDKLSGAASGVEHAVKGAKGKISGFFHHGKEKMLDAEEVIKGAKDAAEDKVSEVKEVTNDKLLETGKNTANLMTNVKESAENKVSEAKEKIENKVENAEDNMIQAKDKAKEKLSGIGEEIKDKAFNLKEGVKGAGEKAGEMAEETVQNLTDIARRARDLAYDMASYVASPRTSRAVWAVVQLLGFATAYGTCVWVTFMSSHVLASVLPRQLFGAVQSKMYPVYFRAMAYGILMAFLGQYFGRGRESVVEKLQAYNLLGAFGMVLVNMFFLEPIATKIMFERMKAEKEEGRGRDISEIAQPVTTPTPSRSTGLASVGTTTTAVKGSADGSFGTTKSTPHTDGEETTAENKLKRLSIKLRRWNSYSSLVNVLTLMSLTWHLVHLARLLSRCQ